jgi:HEAT repeat protein
MLLPLLLYRLTHRRFARRQKTFTDNHGHCNADASTKVTDSGTKNEAANFSCSEAEACGVLGTRGTRRVLLSQTPQQQARDILRPGVSQKSTGKRTQAVRALRLLPGDPEATEMAQRALQDRKPEVRAAAATAIGRIRPINSAVQ